MNYSNLILLYSYFKKLLNFEWIKPVFIDRRSSGLLFGEAAGNVVRGRTARLQGFGELLLPLVNATQRPVHRGARRSQFYTILLSYASQCYLGYILSSLLWNSGFIKNLKDRVTLISSFVRSLMKLMYLNNFYESYCCLMLESLVCCLQEASSRKRDLFGPHWSWWDPLLL